MLKFNDYLKEAALSAKQKKIAKIAGDKDKIDADDLAALRAGKKPVEEASCDGKYMKKEELVGKQHKLDKNHNGKLDAQDFKLLRKEEVELTEDQKSDWHDKDSSWKEHHKHISNSYTDYFNKDKHAKHLEKAKKIEHKVRAKHGDKVADDMVKHSDAVVGSFDGPDGGRSEYYRAKAYRNRHDIVDHDQYDHNPDEHGHIKEEVEQIDELSKDTLGNYVKKAIDSKKNSEVNAKHSMDMYAKHSATGEHPPRRNGTPDAYERSEIHQAKADKRGEGIKLAAKKLGEETLDEGRVKELAMDLKDMSHDEFHKTYGHPKHHYDPTNFKKPVEPGKGMDRAKALAQRGMQSLSKEEVERIEEKLSQLDELSPATLKSYKKGIYRDLDRAADAYPHGTGDDDEDRKLNNRVKGDELADKKLKAKGVNPYSEEVEQIDELSGKTLGSYHQKARKDVRARASDLLWQYGVHHGRDIEDAASEDEWDKDTKADAKKDLAKRKQRDKGIDLAAKKLAKKATANEEVSAEMSPYLKATLSVMDEGKIDNLRDAQKLRQDMQSAYDKDYKPDTSHPHIQVVKGNAYGGANQKDDEGDEKPDETKEKKGRGRPTGSKSGARQKGGGHEDGGIPVHNLNLPKSYK